MDDQFFLRRADTSDINALSQLYQKVYRETYAEDFSIPYPENELNAYFRSSASPQSFAKKIIDPKRAIWVIEDKQNGDLIAFASAGPCNEILHPDVCLNKDGEINQLYFQRNQQNHGFGQQLMNVVLPWLDEYYSGRPIWLSVWFKNYKAQQIYRYYGFEKAGESDFNIGQWKDHDFIMKRPEHAS
ncbi:unnamed protein product [Rotaria sordida]|uniref:N-acetyltransferase domain-containing protein n=1 Tax=Rotaria sordida TaxID=392033 RepID=A0A820G5B9_9BILA|nr:unnamed protein product [Rotaria sordida]